MVVGAQKSHHLLSASCRTRKAGVIQSESRGLSTRAPWYKSWSESESQKSSSAFVQGQENVDVSAQAEKRFAFYLYLCSVQVLHRSNDAHLHR